MGAKASKNVSKREHACARVRVCVCVRAGAALSAGSGLRTSAQPRPTRLFRRAGRTHLVFDTGGLDNHVALGEHLHPVPVTLLPPLAKGPGGAEVSEEEIAGWLETAAPQFEGLLSQLVPK